jgi:hypothetical protein
MSQALASGPFAPLPSEMTTTVVDEAVAAGDDLVPMTPVPEDAPEPEFRHRDLGEPSAVWTYRDAAGRVLGYVSRFDAAAGKQILPRTWWRRLRLAVAGIFRSATALRFGSPRGSPGCAGARCRRRKDCRCGSKTFP